jgi:hypothetical protein
VAPHVFLQNITLPLVQRKRWLVLGSPRYFKIVKKRRKFGQSGHTAAAPTVGARACTRREEWGSPHSAARSSQPRTEAAAGLPRPSKADPNLFYVESQAASRRRGCQMACFSKPKIPVWANFGGPLNGKC